MTFKRLVIAAGLWLAAMSATAQVSPFVVTNTNDSGLGSLRAAILAVNSSCLSAPTNPTVTFNIPGTGPFRIQPLSPLPTIVCPSSIDGYTQPLASPNTQTGGSTDATILIELDGSLCSIRTLPCTSAGLDVQANGVTISGLSIHSFGGPGISFTTPANIFGFLSVFGNFIGTDPGGVTSLGNKVAGIDVVSGFIQVGDLTPANRNLITGNNGPGVNVQSGADFSVINNLIGGRRDGVGGVGNNGAGIASASVFSNNTVAANYIRFNASAGVLVTGAAPNISGPPPANPSIFNNGGKGIDYPGGAPFAPPVVTSFVYDPVANTTTINAQAPASSLLAPNLVDFYHNSAMPPFGEGELFVGRGNVDATGLATVTVPGQAKFVTATFTSCGDGCFGTSEFSLADFPPTLSITFTPDPLNRGSTGTLTLVLQNPNKVRQLGLVGFSFGLPGGLQIGPESAGADCAAGFSLAGASSTVAAASNVTLAPNTTCTITAPVTATGAAGTINIPAGSVTVNSNAGPGTNSAASLVVTAGAVQFSPASVAFPRQNVGTTSPPQTVTLTNIGNGALDIASIVATGDFGYTGCGFPLSLPPGASCTLSITFSPQANGPLAGSISVTSNAVASPSVLPLSGTAVNGPTPGISVQPFSLGLGPIRIGSSVSGGITIFSNGSAPLAISGISVSGAFFSQSNNCPATLAVGATCDITVTYSPAAIGTDTGQVVILSNGDPPTVTVNLTGTSVAFLPPALSVASPVDFGPQVINTTTRHTLDLGNTGEQPLDITALRVLGGPFRLEGACGSIQPGTLCSVTIVFEPTSIGTFRGTLSIVSNDARGTVSVDMLGQGIAVPRAEIDVAPDGIGFANQLITTRSATQTVTVRSVGTAPLNIGGIATTGPFFITANGCGGALPPGGQCQLAVGFLPAAPGAAQGRLTVTSDAVAGRGFASLTGTGCRFYSIAGMRNLQRVCAP